MYFNIRDLVIFTVNRVIYFRTQSEIRSIIENFSFVSDEEPEVQNLFHCFGLSQAEIKRFFIESKCGAIISQLNAIAPINDSYKSLLNLIRQSCRILALDTSGTLFEAIISKLQSLSYKGQSPFSEEDITACLIDGASLSFYRKLSVSSKCWLFTTCPELFESFLCLIAEAYAIDGWSKSVSIVRRDITELEQISLVLFGEPVLIDRVVSYFLALFNIHGVDARLLRLWRVICPLLVIAAEPLPFRLLRHHQLVSLWFGSFREGHQDKSALLRLLDVVVAANVDEMTELRLLMLGLWAAPPLQEELFVQINTCRLLTWLATGDMVKIDDNQVSVLLSGLGSASLSQFVGDLSSRLLADEPRHSSVALKNILQAVLLADIRVSATTTSSTNVYRTLDGILAECDVAFVYDFLEDWVHNMSASNCNEATAMVLSKLVDDLPRYWAHCEETHADVLKARRTCLQKRIETFIVSFYSLPDDLDQFI